MRDAAVVPSGDPRESGATSAIGHPVASNETDMRAAAASYSAPPASDPPAAEASVRERPPAIPPEPAFTIRRTPMPRRRDALRWLTALDVSGLLVTYALCRATGHAKDHTGWLLLAIAVPIALHLARGYHLDAIRSAPAAAARASLAASLAIAASWRWLPPGALALCACFIIWPAATRALLTAWFHRRAQRVRWLVLGSRECLAQFSHDRAVNPRVGDAVLLSREAADGAANAPVSGGWESLDRWLTRSWAGIVVADNESLPDTVVQRLMRARLGGCRVIRLSDFYERYWSKVPIYHLHDGWFALSPGFDLLHDHSNLCIKRLTDIVCATALGLLALPVMLLVAAVIKVTSRGPVFFTQTRVGCGGRPFVLVKFRSMRVDAERDGAKWAAKNDPRAYPFGSFMRTTRLDELPQLLNVLRGDMSFIGPRPERPEFIENLATEIPFYQLRHLVKPGITGWAQVNYPYGASIEDAREKLQYDFYYIKNHSLWLDLVILVKTVRVVLFGLGAR